MADDESIHNPHDRLFRETFARAESLRSFVRAYAPALLPYTPGFEYLLVDLNQPEIRDRVDELRCRFVLHLLHAAAVDRLHEAFRRHGDILGRLSHSLAMGDMLTFLETVVRYAVSVADIDANELKAMVVEHVNDKAGELVMATTAEKWIAEGEARGKILGEIALLQRLIEEKFPNAPAVDLDGLPPRQLEEIGRRILTCTTLEEVFEGLR